MTPRQQEKIATALELGYRVRQDGERITLSPEMRRQFELRLSNASKLRGHVIWPSFHAGTARRFGNRYVTESQYKTLTPEPEMIEA